MYFNKKVCSVVFIFILLLCISSQYNPFIIANTQLLNDNFESNTLTNWQVIQGVPSITSFDNSKWLDISATTTQHVELQAGNFTWSDYNFSFDIYPSQGVDRNVFFRVQDMRTFIIPTLDLPESYMLHLKTDRIILKKWTQTTKPEFVTDTTLSIPNNVKTHILVRVQGNNIKLFLNNSSTPSINYIDIDNPFLFGKVALASFPGSVNTRTLFDNVEVTTIASQSPTPTAVIVPTETATSTPTTTPTPTSNPTPTPTTTPTPTITPTPTATYISLPVPDIKQYDNNWRDLIYDHSQSTIGQLGCALTSAAMVLKYHGAKNINPEILNNWLKSQPDGYLRNGLVNWLAISRYSKPLLEYLRINATSSNILNEMENKHPSIIKVPGHFVVAKGQTNNSFAINDPGYSDRFTLASYPELISLNTFTPSETDLSYMMFVSNEAIKLELKDTNDQSVLTQNFIEFPIENLDNPEDKIGESLSVLLYPKPRLGSYTLNVASIEPGQYLLDTYLYDMEGNVTKQQFKGYIFGNEIDIYPINFNSKNKVTMTFDQILYDLDNAYSNKWIKPYGIYNAIKVQLRNAKKQYTMGHIYVVKSMLIGLKYQITHFPPFFINSEFSKVLTSNLTSLISSL